MRISEGAAALAVLLAAAGAAPARPVETRAWGTADGRPVHLYTLRNAHGMIVRVSDWGGLVTAIEVPDRAGTIANVALGFDTLADYQARNGNYGFGSPIGRYANRIAGARFTIDGREVRLAANDGVNTLHGGPPGYNTRPWQARPFDRGRESGITLRLVSPAGDQGFPGTLTLTITYTLTDADALRIEYRATTDAPTALNLTNHSYFNLAGAGRGDILGQRIRIAADRYAELRPDHVPTGRLLPVSAGYDLRVERPIGDGMATPGLAGGYDTPYVLGDAPSPVPRLAARASDAASGRVMEMLTTEPAVQFFTANHLKGVDHAPGGGAYVKHAGFALEAEHLPDSVHQPAFPTTLLRPGQVYRQTTIYRFSTEPAR